MTTGPSWPILTKAPVTGNTSQLGENFMPDFGAIADLFGGLGDLLSAVSGFLGSVASPLPPFLAGQ